MKKSIKIHLSVKIYFKIMFQKHEILLLIMAGRAIE